MSKRVIVVLFVSRKRELLMFIISYSKYIEQVFFILRDIICIPNEKQN